MRRRLPIIVSAALVVVAAGSVVLAHTASASSAQATAKPKARQFVGYWMGIDPLDGGDSRRGITRTQGGRFALIGRDTVFTLCDGTDRAIVTADDLSQSGRSLVSDNFVIRCTNNGQTIRLKVRYDVLARKVIRETLTTQSGEPVDKIIFHRL